MSSDPGAGTICLQVCLLLLCAWLARMEHAVKLLNEAKLHEHEKEEESGSDGSGLPELARNREKYSTLIHEAWTVSAILNGAWILNCWPERLAAAFGARESWAGPVLAVLFLVVYGILLLSAGWMMPGQMAAREPERVLRSGLPLLRAAAGLMKPFHALAVFFSKGLLHLAGVKPDTGGSQVSEEEIMKMVDIGEEAGAIETDEKEMIENIFELNDLLAEDVMTHRMNVTSFQADEPLTLILQTIEETGLSRFPVYERDMDDVIGILNARDLLLELRREQPRPIRKLLREAYFVPETVQVDTLFRDMQKRKSHMAIVVDEYGGLSGVVTMEDLLEEIVGNIYDETDPAAEAEIVRLQDNLWRIAGSAPLEDVAEALQLELPEEEDVDTLGGLVFSRFTAIPRDGEAPELDADGLHIRVERIADHRVKSALVSRLEPPEADNKEKADDEASRKR